MIQQVYDPWGELLADAGGYDGPGTSTSVVIGPTDGDAALDAEEDSPVRAPSIIVADVDLDRLASVRERMPIQRHREDSSFSFST